MSDKTLRVTLCIIFSVFAVWVSFIYRRLQMVQRNVSGKLKYPLLIFKKEGNLWTFIIALM